MKRIMSIKNRLYSDYLLSERFYEYQELIETAMTKGYLITSVIGYHDLQKAGNISSAAKVIIMRHDIDTDKIAAQKFFDIEKSYGVKSSFYFRLSTIEPRLMNAIEKYGSEASYHYEEISTYCKQYKIRDKTEVVKKMDKIQEVFIANYLKLKKDLSIPMRSIASHGDFVNRYLGVVNQELLTSEIRKQCGIEVEAYDEIIKSECVSISDTLYPVFWKTHNPIELIYKNEKKINILTHPRHWRANIYLNTRENFLRLWEGLCYKFFSH